jgi:hypothetical protein
MDYPRIIIIEYRRNLNHPIRHPRHRFLARFPRPPTNFAAFLLPLDHQKSIFKWEKDPNTFMPSLIFGNLFSKMDY